MRIKLIGSPTLYCTVDAFRASLEGKKNPNLIKWCKRKEKITNMAEISIFHPVLGSKIKQILLHLQARCYMYCTMDVLLADVQRQLEHEFWNILGCPSERIQQQNITIKLSKHKLSMRVWWPSWPPMNSMWQWPRLQCLGLGPSLNKNGYLRLKFVNEHLTLTDVFPWCLCRLGLSLLI